MSNVVPAMHCVPMVFRVFKKNPHQSLVIFFEFNSQKNNIEGTPWGYSVVRGCICIPESLNYDGISTK